MTIDLEGKVALITGAGSGLGEATARAFAGAGSAVACLDLNGDGAERVARECAEGGTESAAFPLDVSDAEAVSRAIDAVCDRFGRLDVCVSCAAIDYTLSVIDMTVEQWDRVLAVNLRAPFLISRAAFPIMRRQGGGHIVNIASTAATRAWANAAAYHASKWGLVGFTRALGVEGRPHGIRATTVIPGGMRTHFFDRFLDEGIPLPLDENLQDPANVARVILFAVTLPADSALQEVIVTPMTETSWP
jgi:NAD(P)-dependent dehydrogenase (short-subunit alcohol dehydrogenase family)